MSTIRNHKSIQLAVLLAFVIVGLIATTAYSGLLLTINTDDGLVDSNWSSTPDVTDQIGDTTFEPWSDITKAWFGLDAAIPTEYYFRIEVGSGPIGSGGTAHIDLDCNLNGSFTDETIDKRINYWIGYDNPPPDDGLGAVFVSKPSGIVEWPVFGIGPDTDDYGEVVHTSYEIKVPASLLGSCATPPFGIQFSTNHGADVATPITYPLPDVNLVLDDGSSEDARGYLFGANAVQFLWFNRFTPPTSDFPFALERVNIQWIADGSGSNMGDAVDVYVWEDGDGNPANGATFRGSVSGTVQATNGDFSTYLLEPPIVFCNPGDILIGTVDRSVVNYVTGPKWPARLDSSSVTANRSWIAAYTSDPGNPPALPANSLYEPINNGTWMIRGHGSTVSLSACGIPDLTTNYDTGAPSSFFTFSGSGFPADSVATVTVNNQELGTVITDSNGDFSLLLSTTNSDEGAYFVTVSVNPSATTSFRLSTDLPTRPQEGSGTVFDVPAGIALTESIFLPTVLR